MLAVIELVPGDQGKRGQRYSKLRYGEENGDKKREEQSVNKSLKLEKWVSVWMSGGHVTGRMMRGKSWQTNPESLL